MSGQDAVLVERIALGAGSAQLGLVTMNRPAELNPIDLASGRALGVAFEELVADEQVRVVAVTGAGRAFSAGGDMKKYQVLQRDAEGFPAFLAEMHGIFMKIPQHPKPFVALVNGITVAGGIELMLACDFAIASTSARIGDAHLNFGQMGGGGVLALLPHAVGPARARELVLSGRLLPPEEALDWGLVSRVVPDDELVAAAVAFATEVAEKSPLAVGNAKRVLNAAYWEGTGLAAGMRLEREATSRYCLTSHDAHEGLSAFADKRRPAFTGR
ncbi:MAG: enoyl-CoA hydratase/isomerase family protein [Pseudonocardia sp.]